MFQSGGRLPLLLVPSRMRPSGASGRHLSPDVPVRGVAAPAACSAPDVPVRGVVTPSSAFCGLFASAASSCFAPDVPVVGTPCLRLLLAACARPRRGHPYSTSPRAPARRCSGASPRPRPLGCSTSSPRPHPLVCIAASPGCGIVACREDRVNKANQRETIYFVFENRKQFFLVLNMHGGNTTGRQQHNGQQQKQHTPQHNGKTHTAQRAQHGATQQSTAPNGTAPHSAAQHPRAGHSTQQHQTTRAKTAQHHANSTVRNSTTPH